MIRASNTAVEMKTSSEWIKTGRKEYLHLASGKVVAYDCNTWGWKIDGKGNIKSLWIAKLDVETGFISGAA